MPSEANIGRSLKINSPISQGEIRNNRSVAWSASQRRSAGEQIFRSGSQMWIA